MLIKEFWVVTKPAGNFSTMRDICFLSSPQTIGLQFLGGLKCEDVIGFYSCRDEAENLASGLIEEKRFEKQ